MSGAAQGWGHVMWAVTWQLAALAVLAWLCERLLRLRAPRARHALWWFVLVAPLALAPARRLLTEGPAALTVTLPQTYAAPLGLAPALAPPAAPPLPPADAGPVSSGGAIHLASVLFWPWALGAGLLLLRLLVGHWRAGRLLRESAPLASPEVAAALSRLSQQAGLRCPVSVRASRQVASAVLYGWRRPVVLVPQAWAKEVTLPDFTSLLAHEVAHVQRADVLTNLLQRLLEAALFFHPGAWLASRRITLVREELCDAWALSGAASRSGYARSLVMAAERAQGQWASAALGVAEERFTLLTRVEAIMRGEGIRKVSRITLTAVASLVLAMAVAFTAVRLCGQEASGGGGGGTQAPGDGGGGGWHSAGGAGDGPVTGGDGGGGWHGSGSGPEGGGNALAATPPVTFDQLDQKQVRHYRVGKRLADLPKKEGLSTPESALAAIVRTMLRADSAQWRRLSPPELRQGGGGGALPPMSPENQKLYSGLTVEEVWIYQDRWAAVISRFPSLAGQKAGYNVRFVLHQGKQWLNLGEDVPADLDSARRDAAQKLYWMERRPKLEAEALRQAWEHPEQYAATAERVFEQLRRVDYAAYLARTNPDEWQPLPVDYTVSSDYPSWADWVCRTFSRNPIRTVQLGKVLKDDAGRPSVPYTLTLQDGTALSGVLRFTLSVTDRAEWITGPGLDWHQRN